MKSCASTPRYDRHPSGPQLRELRLVRRQRPHPLRDVGCPLRSRCWRIFRFGHRCQRLSPDQRPRHRAGLPDCLRPSSDSRSSAAQTSPTSVRSPDSTLTPGSSTACRVSNALSLNNVSGTPGQTRTIELLVTDAEGCEHTATLDVEWVDGVQFSLTSPNTPPCAGTGVLMEISPADPSVDYLEHRGHRNEHCCPEHRPLHGHWHQCERLRPHGGLRGSAATGPVRSPFGLP